MKLLRNNILNNSNIKIWNYWEIKIDWEEINVFNLKKLYKKHYKEFNNLINNETHLLWNYIDRTFWNNDFVNKLIISWIECDINIENISLLLNAIQVIINSYEVEESDNKIEKIKELLNEHYSENISSETFNKLENYLLDRFLIDTDLMSYIINNYNKQLSVNATNNDEFYDNMIIQFLKDNLITNKSGNIIKNYDLSETQIKFDNLRWWLIESIRFLNNYWTNKKVDIYINDDDMTIRIEIIWIEDIFSNSRDYDVYEIELENFNNISDIFNEIKTYI